MSSAPAPAPATVESKKPAVDDGSEAKAGEAESKDAAEAKGEEKSEESEETLQLLGPNDA